jgi:hypothetical protein
LDRAPAVDIFGRRAQSTADEGYVVGRIPQEFGTHIAGANCGIPQFARSASLVLTTEEYHLWTLSENS